MNSQTVRESGVINVRPFDVERDLEAAYRSYVSGFHHNSWPIIEQAEPRFIKDEIMMHAEICAGSFVAEIEGVVRGVLLGCYLKENRNSLRLFLLNLRYVWRFLIRRYRMSPLARAMFRDEIRSELTYLRHHVKTEAEVLLLASEEGYRGGIGRALMDAWVEETRARGIERTTVGTDTTLNWRFYERYGFERVKEFPMKIYRRSLPGVEVTGYIYALDL